MPPATATPAGCRPSLQERLRQKIKAKEAARHPRKHDDHAFRIFLAAAGVKPGKRKQENRVLQDVMMANPRLPYIYHLGCAPCFLPPRDSMYTSDVGLHPIVEQCADQDLKVDNENDPPAGQELMCHRLNQDDSLSYSDGDSSASSSSASCSSHLDGDRKEASGKETGENFATSLLYSNHSQSNQPTPLMDSTARLNGKSASIVNIQKEEADNDDEGQSSPVSLQTDQSCENPLSYPCDGTDAPAYELCSLEDQPDCTNATEVPDNVVSEDVDHAQVKAFQYLSQSATSLNKILVNDATSNTVISSNHSSEDCQEKVCKKSIRGKEAKLKAGRVKNLSESSTTVSPGLTNPQGDKLNSASCRTRENNSILPCSPEKVHHRDGRRPTARGKSIRMPKDYDLENIPYPDWKCGDSSKSFGAASAQTDKRKDCKVQKRRKSHKGQRQTTTLVLCCDDSVWSEGSPLVNIYFRFDKGNQDDNSLASQRTGRFNKGQNRFLSHFEPLHTWKQSKTDIGTGCRHQKGY